MLPHTRRLVSGLLQGDRASLSRAITLVESMLPAHRAEAELLLQAVLQERTAAHAAAPPTVRVGIAGPPGAGKSSLIEALGLCILGESPSARVAVVAVDPSSSRTGGSILGDKTRMGALSAHPRVYIRPSPARGFLGGLARATHEVVQLCEGAGYGTVLVETVGLGQSETAIEAAVDCTVLVLPPAAGDELQGVKKGIVECADLIVVNKADGSLENAALNAAVEYRNALGLSRGKHGSAWAPRVLTASAATHAGVPQLWGAVQDFLAAMAPALAARRRAQAEEWMWGDFREAVVKAAEGHPRVREQAERQRELISRAATTPRSAARELLRALQFPG